MRAQDAANMAKWPKPNYINPTVKGHYLTPIITCLMVTTGLIVLLRIYSRAVLLHSMGSDDYVIIPAYIFAVGCSVGNILSEAIGGWGRHLWDVEPAQWRTARQLSVNTQLTFTMSIALTKVSILLFYLRFLRGKKYIISIWVTMAFLIGWVVSMMFVIFFQCRPLSAYWGNDPHRKCLKYESELHIVHGCLNVFSDVLVLVIPIPTILQLQMPMRQKIGLIGVFSLGGIVCCAGILRIVSIHQTTQTSDVSWYGYDLWVYTSIEAQIGVFCACIPAIKPLIVQIFPRYASTQPATESKQGITLGSIPAHAHIVSSAPKKRNNMFSVSSMMSSRDLFHHSRSASRSRCRDSEEFIFGVDEKNMSTPTPPGSSQVQVFKTTEIEIKVEQQDV